MATATKKQEQFTFNSYERNVKTQIIHGSWIPLIVVIKPTIIILANSYIKVTGCVSVCVFVPKDLTYYRSVWLYSEASKCPLPLLL